MVTGGSSAMSKVRTLGLVASLTCGTTMVRFFVSMSDSMLGSDIICCWGLREGSTFWQNAPFSLSQKNSLRWLKAALLRKPEWARRYWDLWMSCLAWIDLIFAVALPRIS